MGTAIACVCPRLSVVQLNAAVNICACAADLVSLHVLNDKRSFEHQQKGKNSTGNFKVCFCSRRMRHANFSSKSHLSLFVQCSAFGHLCLVVV